MARNVIVFVLASFMLFEQGLSDLSEQSLSVITNFHCDPNALNIDRALLHFTVASDMKSQGVLLYAVNYECFKCSNVLLFNSSSPTSCTNVWTPFAWNLYLENRDGAILGSLTDIKFGYHGVYNITSTSASPITVATLMEPDLHPNRPIQLWLAALIGLAIAAFALPWLHARFNQQYSTRQAKRHDSTGLSAGSGIQQPLLTDEEEEKQHEASALPLPTPHTSPGDSSKSRMPVNEKNHTATSAPSRRLDCLDTFRGICLALMIFVNYGGGHYWYTEHSAWNGFTIADLLFPWFMWVMGCSMALSMRSLYVLDMPEGKAENVTKVWYRVARRSAILFALGLFLGNGNYVTRGHWRVPGVLQYFAVSYFLVSATMIVARKQTRALLQSMTSSTTAPVMSERESDDECTWGTCASLPCFPFSAYRYELAIQCTLFSVYIIICLFAPSFPGCPAGYNGPGGISQGGRFSDCTGGVHRYLDLAVLGYERIYHHPTCIDLYDCLPYDPEGLLGSLGATFLTFLGLMTGRVLLHTSEARPWDRVSRWLFWGMFLTLLAGMLCGFTREEGLIPINKVSETAQVKATAQ